MGLLGPQVRAPTMDLTGANSTLPIWGLRGAYLGAKKTHVWRLGRACLMVHNLYAF